MENICAKEDRSGRHSARRSDGRRWVSGDACAQARAAQRIGGPNVGGPSEGMRVGQPSTRGRPSAPSWSTVDHGALGSPWDWRGSNTLSMHGSECFLHNLMVQIAVNHDRMAEDEFRFD